MRRAHTANGAGYQPSSQVIEDENERLEGELSNKVKVLKSMTIDMGHEVREHNKLLSDMNEDYDKSGNLLQFSMGRLKAITKAGGPKLWCFMLLFAFFVFFVIWIILKFR